MESFEENYFKKRKVYLKRRKVYLKEVINLADKAFLFNDYEESAYLYSFALATLPKTSVLFFKKAYSFYFLGQNEKALEGLNKAISIEPSNDKILPDFYYYRACVYVNMKDFEKAELDYKASIDHSPESSVAYFSLCLLYMMIRQPQKAMRYVSIAISKEPRPEYITAERIIRKYTDKEYSAEQLTAFLKEVDEVSSKNKSFGNSIDK